MSDFSLETFDGVELAEMDDPPATDLMLGPLIIRGCRTIIVGDTGHGKTTLVTQLLAAIITGGEALGYQAAPIARLESGPSVLYIDLEQGRRTVKRIVRERDLEREEFSHTRSPGGLFLGTNDAHLRALTGVLDWLSPRIVVLDPLYKAIDGDSNDEAQVMRLMHVLDTLREEYGFALLIVAHPRKDPVTGKAPRKLSLHDIAGHTSIVRGPEVILAIERVSHGYARLRFLKDRDEDLPVGEAWGLIFDREHGFRRDPADLVPARDLAVEVEAYVREHPRSTTNEIVKAIGAGKTRVSEVLKTSELFTFEPGPNRSFLWVVSDSQNHPDHPDPPEGAGGVPVGGPSLEGHHQTTTATGAPVVSETTSQNGGPHDLDELGRVHVAEEAES